MLTLLLIDLACMAVVSLLALFEVVASWRRCKRKFPVPPGTIDRSELFAGEMALSDAVFGDDD